MKTLRGISSLLAGLFVLFALIVGLSIILQSANSVPGASSRQEELTPGPSEEGYPPPMWGPTIDPTIWAFHLTAEASEQYVPPTATEPPFPTPVPTPVVTPIPLAGFPAIPGLPEGSPEPFTLIYPEGNVLHAIDSDGQNARVLVDISAKAPMFLVNRSFGLEHWGSASPDGKRLALVLADMAEPSQEKGGARAQFGIYLYELDSGDLRLLVQDAVEPVWSPDGTRVAYRGADSGLWIMDINTSETKLIYDVDRENSHFVTEMDWSPDGMQLVFIDRAFRQSETIIIVKSDGSQSMQLVTPETGYFLRSPRWSPDGKKIAFISVTGEKSASDYFDNLWLVNPDGTNQIQITFDLYVSSTPIWSPNSQWLAFSGTKFYEEPKPYTDLWIVDVGGELKRLTWNVIENVTELLQGWSPDGSQIIFLKQIYVPEDNTAYSLSLSTGIQILLYYCLR